MSGLPTSGSEAKQTDPVERIWILSAQAKDGHDIRDKLKSVDITDLSALDRKTCLAVTLHVETAFKLVNGWDVTEKTWLALPSLWEDVVHEIRHASTSLTPTAHAFHMRLVSKYADYYRTFEQKAIEQWVLAARSKSEFLKAVAVSRTGQLASAAQLVDAISLYWREHLPVRLPGLYEIEKTGASWAAASGNGSLPQPLMNRLKQESGRLAPYTEDEPAMARLPRKIERTARFAFGASVIPPQLTS